MSLALHCGGFDNCYNIFLYLYSIMMKIIGNGNVKNG